MTIANLMRRELNPNDDVLKQAWHHFVLVYTGTAAELYIDATKELDITTSIDTQGTTFGIGKGVNTDTGLRGYISSVRIYDRALSDAEITTLSQEYIRETHNSSDGFNNWGKPVRYRSASLADCNVVTIPTDGLVFYTPLSSSSATAQTGQTLVENNISSGISFQPYKDVPCVRLQNGSYIYVSDGYNQLPSGSSPWTISTWAAAEWAQGAAVFGYGRHNYGSTEAFIWVTASGNIEVNIFQNGFSSGVQYEVGSWFHVAFTYDGTTIKSYVNGIAGATKDITMDMQRENLAVSGLGGTGVVAFIGYVAACRIYNRALSEKEIKKLANEFSPS